MNFVVVKRGSGKSKDRIGYRVAFTLSRMLTRKFVRDAESVTFTPPLSMEHEVKERMNVEVVDMAA